MYVRRLAAFSTCFAVSVIAFAPRSHAVILAGGTSTTGTDPSSAPIGFANVGFRTNADQPNIKSSAVYLGNSTVITAAHVGAGDTTIGGVLYNAVAGTTVQLQNSDSTFADLVVFKINGNPGLPSLSIPLVTPISGTMVDMTGFGNDRSSDTPTSISTTSGTKSGYTWAGTQTGRYGTNNTQHFFDYRTAGSPDLGYLINVSDGVAGHPKTTVFTTDFTQANPDDAQATSGDSGGGVFNSTTHELVGVIVGTYPYTGQPGGTSVFGEYTFSANLATYRTQILAAVPEPAGLACIGLWGLTLLKRRR